MKDSGISPEVSLNILFEIASTNETAKSYVACDRVLPLVVVAEFQKHGKGQHGRQWLSGIAKNITLSFAWRFKSRFITMQLLNIAIGLAVIKILKKRGISNLGLKWPNDVQIDGKKVCGILLEIITNQNFDNIIIGVGLNIKIDQGTVDEIDQPWTDLVSHLSGTLPSRNQIIAELTNELVSVCRLFEKGYSIEHYLPSWQRYDVLFNKAITIVTTTSQQYSGIARGISGNGALMVEKNGDIISVLGGEVSVRYL